MKKNTIVLNEAELQNLIKDCVNEVLNEGFLDKENIKKMANRVKAGWEGAKSGYSGQKMLDRGTDDFKQNWDRQDLANKANPWASNPENTADMQARDAYKRYKEYQQLANKFLNLYNQLTKKYNLQKKGVGQRVTAEKPNFYGTGGIVANQREKNSNGSFGSTVKDRRSEVTKPRGIWG